LITSPDGRAVIYDVAYRNYREIRGGAAKADESSAVVCGRNSREALGISIAVERLLVIDHPTDDGQRSNSVMYLYNGGVGEDPALNLYVFGGDRGVLVEPRQLSNATNARLTTRIEHALTARATGDVSETINDALR
jgi:8-oxo-dGTP diphosphatase